MDDKEEYKGKITPQKALDMLKKEGMNVTLDEAEDILNFLQEMANIQVSKFLKEDITNPKKK
jgi:type II restriction/modification system DNA methylase subunit YeeA